jgi:hypothetical protein
LRSLITYLVAPTVVILLAAYVAESQTISGSKKERKFDAVIFATNPKTDIPENYENLFQEGDRKCIVMKRKLENLPAIDRNEYWKIYKYACMVEQLRVIRDAFITLKTRMEISLEDNKSIRAKIINYDFLEELSFPDLMTDYKRQLNRVDEILGNIYKQSIFLDNALQQNNNAPEQGNQVQNSGDAGQSQAGFLKFKDLNLISEREDIGIFRYLNSQFRSLYETISFKGRGQLILFGNDDNQLQKPGEKITQLFTHFYNIIRPTDEAELNSQIYFRLFMYDLAQKTRSPDSDEITVPLYYKRTREGEWRKNPANYLGIMQGEFDYIIKQFTSR